MYLNVLYEQTPSTPYNVQLYLNQHGWTGNGAYFYPANVPGNVTYGYYTWEQALIYTMWARMHLGAV